MVDKVDNRLNSFHKLWSKYGKKRLRNELKVFLVLTPLLRPRIHNRSPRRSLRLLACYEGPCKSTHTLIKSAIIRV